MEATAVDGAHVHARTRPDGKAALPTAQPPSADLQLTRRGMAGCTSSLDRVLCVGCSTPTLPQRPRHRGRPSGRAGPPSCLSTQERRLLGRSTPRGQLGLECPGARAWSAVASCAQTTEGRLRPGGDGRWQLHRLTVGQGSPLATHHFINR